MAAVDLSWHAPAQSLINNLTNVISTTGVYGYIYNSSATPDAQYGVYNWCNMPHVRKDIYTVPSSDYELAYVELIHRHHKRTPYASNSFPVESYPWTCTDQGLFYYGRSFDASAPPSAETYWKGFTSPINPFVPSGFQGDCQFPQITSGGLADSHQHGADLYAVYHDLLHFLPSHSDPSWRSQVSYRVTNNQITSQVAGMVVDAMFAPTSPVPLLVQNSNVDSLEPTYSCPAASAAFNSIKSHSNPTWQAHLTAVAGLYSALDDISGVPPTDDGWHLWLDHYYDNLSARQCHSKPLPCKLVSGANSTICVTQSQADEVYRLGHWEYSRLYRDEPTSLPASAASMGVWFAELASHLRAVKDGSKVDSVKYRHNVAHDGSVSRVLSFLQIDDMVWPGMGSEVVFELYKKKTSSSPTTTALPTPTQKCNRDNCFRQLFASSASASSFCPTFTPSPSAAIPAWLNNCKGDRDAVASACACVVAPTATAAPEAPKSESGLYVRVLFGGRVFRSSNPSLGTMDMLPVETLLGYIDGLVGVDAGLVKGKCSS
ncbi:Histidine acid phosphatase [Coniochaeta hoffmannii]|uniref:Histidine acid phosphatase n=1 Tax=Coniochaeta hoffmannii TaxID=91930 RepID=A0AA38RPZ6_9PEZI|nr:Histidine acid phosphatase [Coniochaeta hoffmannii]